MSIRNYIEFSEDDKRTINQLLEEGTDIIDILRASNAMKSYKRVNTQSAWVQLNSKISDKKLKSYIPVAIAASLILLFAAIFMLKNTSEITYSTGEMASHIILDDGSEIILEPHGEIKVSKDYNKVNRAIELKGDAYFDISKDKDLPFTITSEKCDISVLGTKFFVEQSDNSLIIDLIEGNVLIEDKNGNMGSLKEKERAVIAKNIKIESVEDQQIEERADKDIFFDNVSVKDAISEFNRIYKKDIVILDQGSLSLNDTTLHVKVKNGSVKEFLDIMKILFDVDIIDSKGQFIVSTK